MGAIVFDIEGDGLLDDITQMWCVVTRDVDTDEVKQFYQETLDDFILELDKADTLICHNIIEYDLPVIGRFYDWYPNTQKTIIDTLVWSRCLHPDRPSVRQYDGKSGPHSLAQWGYRVGRGKPDHDDWTRYSHQMLHRCTEDVEINHLVYKALLQEAEV